MLVRDAEGAAADVSVKCFGCIAACAHVGPRANACLSI